MAVAARSACAAGFRYASADPADTIAVVLRCPGRDPRVALAEPSSRPPRPRTVGPSAESGRGLSELTAPADDRGTDPPEPGDVGETAWFSPAVREPM
jgi:hypothetical protein